MGAGGCCRGKVWVADVVIVGEDCYRCVFLRKTERLMRGGGGVGLLCRCAFSERNQPTTPPPPRRRLPTVVIHVPYSSTGLCVAAVPGSILYLHSVFGVVRRYCCAVLVYFFLIIVRCTTTTTQDTAVAVSAVSSSTCSLSFLVLRLTPAPAAPQPPTRF